MGEIKLSLEQELGVYLHGANILVSAAAGSGKTFVLVERIVSRIMDRENPCNIDDFLLVTYTKAAANEMRMRIGERLRKEVEKDKSNLFLQRQLTLLHKASISTVHGFCSEIIKSNFHLLGIPHNFRICDDVEANLIKNEIVGGLLEDGFEEASNEAFEAFAGLFSTSRSDQGLIDVILKVYESSQSQVFPEKWIKKLQNSFALSESTPVEDTIWGKVVMEKAKDALENGLAVIDEALDAIFGIAELAPRRDGFLQDREKLYALNCLRAQGFDALQKQMEQTKFDRLATVKGYDKEYLAYLKDLRDGYKGDITKLAMDYFYMEGKEFLQDMLALKDAMDVLCTLVLKFSQAYSSYKLQKNMLTFSDLEHYAIALLIEEKDGEKIQTKVAKEVQTKYKEVLVDEFQDTNEIQSTIFEAVSRDNLFMVGDVKQSIYKFRQAQPEIFIQKYLSYESSKQGAFEAKKNSRIVFSGNFRSRKSVLDCVNFVFSTIMSAKLGDIDYTQEQQLNPKAEYPQSSKDQSELIIIERDKIALAWQEDEEEADSVLEAKVIAKKIRSLMQTMEVYQPKTGTSRSLQYGDIAILLRSQKNRAIVYQQVLDDYGIPCHSDEGETYLDAVEVMVMLSLLQVIDNPRQDIPLISIMRSSVFAFSEDELLAIRLTQTNGLFYDSVEKSAKNGNEKCSAFLKKLKEYRYHGKEQTIDVFLWYLYEDTGYYFRVMAMENGEKRANNLKMLYEYARQYEESSYKGLFNFINYINNIIETKGDLLPHKASNEGGDVVKIMTIHKSKGLEFPVCFLGSCGKRFNMLDAQGDLLLHGSLLGGVQYKNRARGITYPTIAKQAITLTLKKEALSEEERVLYVAMTRAKEKLIMVGVCGEAEKLANKAARGILGQQVGSYALEKCTSYLEWLTVSMLLHPSGTALRNLVTCQDILPKESDSPITITVVSQLEELEPKELHLEEEEKQPISDVVYQRICNNLSGAYDLPSLQKTPSKLSVTELKGKGIDLELQEDAPKEPIPFTDIFETPKFISAQKGMTAAQKGTALHSVMQFIRYEKAHNKEDVLKEIDRLVESKLITKEQGEVCDISKIVAFFESPLGKAIMKSPHVYREEKFNLMVPAKEVYFALANKKEGERHLLIQGVIDCFFVTQEGSAVLVDFKTDKGSKNNETLIKERYGGQLRVYKKAIEEIYSLAVCESYIYLFSSGEVVSMN